VTWRVEAGHGEAAIFFWFWVGIAVVAVAVALYALVTLGFLMDATVTERMTVLDLVGRSDRWWLPGRSCSTYRPPFYWPRSEEGYSFVMGHGRVRLSGHRGFSARWRHDISRSLRCFVLFPRSKHKSKRSAL